MTATVTDVPLVSIIIPVFNGERYLRESVDSILTQTYSNIEVLLMDDASTDGTAQIAASYGDRLKYHKQPQNKGIYGNTNDGIARASGDYIAVYHADDIYQPTIVEREISFLDRYPEAGAVFCQDIFIDPQAREIGRLKLPPELRGGRPMDYSVIFNALLKYKNRFLRCPSAMVRAGVYRDVGVYRDKEFLNTSDLEMWLRIGRKYSIGILEEYLLRYRYGHGNSAQRYRFLRTDPERYFEIMDLYLKDTSADLITPAALAGYEAHRSEDLLMRVINHYILDRLEEARTILRQVRITHILASSVVQRARLVTLLVTLRCVLWLPRVHWISAFFHQRWHSKGVITPNRSLFPAV